MGNFVDGPTDSPGPGGRCKSGHSQDYQRGSRPHQGGFHLRFRGIGHLDHRDFRCGSQGAGTASSGYFFALGFALGNVVGIKAEQFLALGFLVVRVISRDNWQALADKLRNAGFGVTSFIGQGVSGPVGELSVICRRRNFAKVVQIVQAIDPGAFYYTEMAGAVNRSCRPYVCVPGVRK